MQASSVRKLVISAVVLAAVFGIAVLRQRHHVNPLKAAEFVPPAERPVFGTPPETLRQRSAGEEAADGPQNADTGEDELQAGAEAPADVLGFLEKWRRSLIAGDVDTQVACYAPVVRKFFRERNVTREAVRREKERLMRRYPEVSRYRVRDVKLEELKRNRAVVTFTKDWEASGDGRFAGSERQRLTLQKYGNDWAIVGEEELKVYWVHRG